MKIFDVATSDNGNWRGFLYIHTYIHIICVFTEVNGMVLGTICYKSRLHEWALHCYHKNVLYVKTHRKVSWVISDSYLKSIRYRTNFFYIFLIVSWCVCVCVLYGRLFRTPCKYFLRHIPWRNIAVGFLFNIDGSVPNRWQSDRVDLSGSVRHRSVAEVSLRFFSLLFMRTYFEGGTSSL